MGRCFPDADAPTILHFPRENFQHFSCRRRQKRKPSPGWEPGDGFSNNFSIVGRADLQPLCNRFPLHELRQIIPDAGREQCLLGEPLLGQIDRVREAVRGFGNAERGLLRIGASTTPGYYLLPRVLGRFRRAHPGIELQFTVENSLAIERRILHNELDLGFIGTQPTRDGLRAESIADDEIVCFGPADHPLAKRKRVPPNALSKKTWLVREEGSATRQAFERWLKKAGAALRHTIELRSPEAIKALVREGVGISFMSIVGVKEELRRGQVKRINISGSRLTRAIYLVRHLDKHLSPSLHGFLALVSAHHR